MNYQTDHSHENNLQKTGDLQNDSEKSGSQITGFLVQQDIESVREILGMTWEQFAREIGVTRLTLSNWINDRNTISPLHLKEFYELSFRKGIRLNRIKEQLYREDMIRGDEVLLFHGSKNRISGPISLEFSRKLNDFGKGFYCGESLEQSAMFVSAYKDPSLYMLKFDPGKLKVREYHVDREWMLTIAYFRGKLSKFEGTRIVKKIEEANKDTDYIIAPIADNRMFEIIDSFLDGEITDIQCQHCLSATNLGRQYVFISQKALNNVTILERCFLADDEKASYLAERQENFAVNTDKVKLAKRQYRNQGQYIEEILNENDGFDRP